MKLMKPGNGNQQVNHKLAVQWLVNSHAGVTLADDRDHVILDGREYRVTVCVEQDKLMLANTKHNRNPLLPEWLAEVEGLLCLYQKKDGRLIVYRLDDVQKLWDSKDGMVAISWEIARTLAKPTVYPGP